MRLVAWGYVIVGGAVAAIGGIMLIYSVLQAGSTAGTAAAKATPAVYGLATLMSGAVLAGIGMALVALRDIAINSFSDLGR